MRFGVWDWLIFIAVPAIAWVLGRKGRQTGTWRGYFLATGNLSTTGVVSTYFGANLTFTAIFLILSEEAYMRGWWLLAMPVFWILGTTLFVILYPKLRPYFEKGMTLHQALGESFSSPTLQKWASLWTIVAFVGTVALEFYGGIRLLQWTNIPLLVNVTIALLLAFIVSVITVTGGFRGIAWADLWLDIIALAATVALTIFVIPYIFGHTSMPVTAAPSSKLPPMLGTSDNIIFVIAAALIFLPFQFCTLDSWQRMGAWKERQKSPASWLLGAGLLLSIVYCVPIALGIAVREQGLSVPADSHPLKLFLDSLHLAPGLLGLIFAGFISAMFSTADELLNCCSLSLLFDTFQISRSESKRTQSEENKLVISGQFYTILFALVAALLALLAIKYNRQISDMALAAFSAQVVFTFPLIATIFFPNLAQRLGSAATRSMLLSFLAAVLSVIVGWILKDKRFSDGAPIVAFIVAALFFIPPLLWAIFHSTKGE